MAVPHSASASTPALPAGLTYARARLWLGVTGVGTMVLLAAAALATDLPARVASADPAQPVVAAALQVAGAVFAATLLLLPLELLGGAVVARARPGFAPWAARWVRGVAVQALVWTACAAALLTAGRAYGAWGAVAAAVPLQLLLLAARAPLARAAAHLPQRQADGAMRGAAERAGLEPDRVRVVESRDEGFVGGWVGLVRPVLWIPAHWARLPADALAAQLVRRRLVRERGLHARGLLVALAWNGAGLALALHLPGGGATTAAALLGAVAWLTLWSFLGLLVLPTPSRRAVFAADAGAAAACGRDPVRRAVQALDGWQDDEADRPVGVETIFHPVPARGARLAALDAPDAAPAAPSTHLAAHQAARHALFAAWALLSPLSRAVHCNVGRPALWVVWPGD